MTNERRPLVTLAVCSGGDRRRAKDLLSSLADQLLPGDSAVLVGPHNDPRACSSWREVRGHGQLVTPSSVPRPRELLLVLDDRAQCSDGLVRALTGAMSAHDDVGAVAARTNIAQGDELLLGVPYSPRDRGALRAHLRACAGHSMGRTTAARHLGGPCVLVRRHALERAGGMAILAQRDGLARLLDEARVDHPRFLVAEDAYVHHPGGPPHAPFAARERLVSACLIVRDEEHQLETCLASAAGVADELVVYDTGSIDGTVALARRLGARVIEGTWEGDFARARNAALEHCRGQWILWLDADETLVCEDPANLRDQLASTESAVEGYLVLIDNLQGTEASTTMTHPAVRLFRRGSCHWEGRLHEQVVPRAHDRGTSTRLQELARITHRGYLQDALRDRDKAARNLRAALGDLFGDSGLDLGTRVLSVGRSYILGSKLEEGVDLCRRALELSPNHATTRLAIRSLATGLLALGRPDEVPALAARVRAISRVPALADLLEAEAHLLRDEPEEALACFDRVGEVIDDDGFQYHSGLTANGRARAFTALGRPDAAADTLLGAIAEHGGLDAHLGRLLEALEAAGRDPGEILHVLPPERRVAFLPQLLQLQPLAADRVLEAWHRQVPTELPILATAAQVALRLPLERQLVWSHRLRSVGVSAPCPLVVTATTGRPPEERALAAAIASVSFEDPRALYAFSAACIQVGDAARPSLQEQLALLAPALQSRLDHLLPAEPAVAAVATRRSPGRQTLLITPSPSDLPMVVLASELSRHGHDVTLLAPGPRQPFHQTLESSGTAVRTYLPFEDDHDGIRSCLAASALLYATRTFDTVVLARSLRAHRAELSRRFPLAQVVDGSETLPLSPFPLERLFGRAPRTPHTLRQGIFIVDLSESHPAPDPNRLDLLLSAIASELPEVPVSLWSTERTRRPWPALPGLLQLGPLLDPTPWLRASRITLIFAGHGEEVATWQHLSQHCGAPQIHITPSADLATVLPTLALHLDGAAPPLEPESHPPLAASSAVVDHDPPTDPFHALPHRARRHLKARTERGPLRFVATAGDRLLQACRELACHLADPLGREIPIELREAEHLPSTTNPPLADATPSPRDAPPTDPPAIVEIRHQWQLDPTPSHAAHLVVYQPFELGGMPAEWIGPLRDLADEVWVPSSWARSCAIGSGVPADMVHVVPHGVDVQRFHPDGPQHPLRTTKRARLLFVGPCALEGGIDVLLETYLSTFTRDDNVCLVVATVPSGGVPSDTSLETTLRDAASSDGPEIEILDGPLDADELAALYRSCDALVHPYRGEAFGERVAEAMASGLPVIVSRGGACDDLCDDRVARMVATHPVAVPQVEWTLTPAGACWLEPSRADLAASLREVVDDPESLRAMSPAARDRILQGFTWGHAAEIAARRLSPWVAAAPPAPHGHDRALSAHRPCASPQPSSPPPPAPDLAQLQPTSP